MAELTVDGLSDGIARRRLAALAPSAVRPREAQPVNHRRQLSLVTSVLVVLMAHLGPNTAGVASTPSNRVPPPQAQAILLGPAAAAYGGMAVGTVVPLKQVTEIAFATRQIGYALGGPLGSTYPLRTIDGGRIWRVDGPAFFLPIADGAEAVGELIAVSATEALAYGGGGSSIDITTDGGEHWWRVYLGQGIVAVAQHGNDLWALAAGSTTSEDAIAPVWLYDSGDGGRIWRYRSSLEGIRGWEGDLLRPSADRAFALVKSFSDQAPRGGHIVETTDGGTTWKILNDRCNQRVDKASVDWTERLEASSATSLWLLCGGGEGFTMSQVKVVYRSDNAGRSWTLVASSGAPWDHSSTGKLPLVGQWPNSTTSGALAVTSSSDAWVTVGGDDVLWKTTDGGSDWIAGAPDSVEQQFPEQFAVPGGSLFVKTQNALWNRQGSQWSFVAGSPGPSRSSTTGLMSLASLDKLRRCTAPDVVGRALRH